MSSSATTASKIPKDRRSVPARIERLDPGHAAGNANGDG